MISKFGTLITSLIIMIQSLGQRLYLACVLPMFPLVRYAEARCWSTGRNWKKFLQVLLYLQLAKKNIGCHTDTLGKHSNQSHEAEGKRVTVDKCFYCFVLFFGRTGWVRASRIKISLFWISSTWSWGDWGKCLAY